MNKKSALSIIFGIAMIYVWNYLLFQSGARSMLWLAYIVVGFSVSAMNFGSRKAGVKECLMIAAAFGLVLGAIDIALISIQSFSLIALAIADIALKVGISIVGSLVFFLFQKSFFSERKIAFSNAGLLSRRLVSGLIDLQILLLIFGGLTILFLPIPPSIYINAVGIVLIVFFYKFAHEAQYGQTPGKRTVGIKVNSSKAGMFVRNIPFALLFVAPYAGTVLLNVIYLILSIDLLLILTGRRLFDFLGGSSIADAKA